MEVQDKEFEARLRALDGWRAEKAGEERRLSTVSAGAGGIAAVVFAGHKEYRGLVPAEVRRLCGCPHPAIVDGRNVVDPDAWIGAGFSYRGIGRGDKNQHALRGQHPNF